MRTRRSRLLLALSLATATLAGCNNSTEPKPGKPTHIAISAGEAQSGSVGAQLSAPIAVKITDDRGRGVPGVAVDFLVTSGAGQLSATASRAGSPSCRTGRR